MQARLKIITSRIQSNSFELLAEEDKDLPAFHIFITTEKLKRYQKKEK